MLTRRTSASVVSVDREAGTIDIMFDAWCRGDDPPFRVPIPLAMPLELQRAGCDFTCSRPRFEDIDPYHRPRVARERLMDPTLLTEFEELPYGSLSIGELEELIGFKRFGEAHS